MNENITNININIPDINIPDIYDLFDYNGFRNNKSNIIQHIKIEIINKNIRIYVYYDNFYIEYKNNSEEKNILKFKDIFENINTRENNQFTYYSHLFFKINNNNNKHILVKDIFAEKNVKLFQIFDNLLYNDIYPLDCILDLDATHDDIIIIYISHLINHLAPYQFKNLITDKIKLDKYCKYITIKLKDIDYDYNINNQIIEIKKNNNIIKIKCIIQNNDLNLIFIKINNNYTGNILNKNCKICNRVNDYDKFTNITKEIKEYLKHNFLKNIIDCDDHYFYDDNLFKFLNNIYIDISDLLKEIGINTSKKLFEIRYNYLH